MVKTRKTLLTPLFIYRAVRKRSYNDGDSDPWLMATSISLSLGTFILGICGE